MQVLELDPKQIKRGWRARADYGDIGGLASSIEELGQLQPVAVRKNKKGDYFIVAGMRRTNACKKLGIKVKATIVSPKTELSALQMQLAENTKRKDFDKLEMGEGLQRYKTVYEKMHPEVKHGALGGGKGDKTKKKSTEAKKFASEAAGALGISESLVYQVMDIGKLPAKQKEKIDKAASTGERNKLAKEAIREQRFKKKEEKLEETAKEVAKTKPSSKPNNRPITLHHGDNIKLLGKIKKGSVDLICTDPPYDLERSLVTHVNRASINKGVAWDKLDVGWVLKYAPKIKAGGQLIAFCPMEAIGDYKAVCKKAGLTWRGSLVWHKANPGTVHRNVYLSACEAMIWATKGGGYFFKPWKNAGAEEVHNVIRGPICGGNERLDHSAQKPEWLIERLLKRHAHITHTVVDPFVGTGTTLVCCKKLRIEAIGIEASEKYVKLAVKRLKAI